MTLGTVLYPDEIFPYLEQNEVSFSNIAQICLEMEDRKQDWTPVYNFQPTWN